MAYCGPLGLPHSKFLDWDPTDQDKALAWLGFEKSKCPSCNTFPSEYLDAEGRMKYPPPYRVYTEICYGCVAIHDKNEEMTKMSHDKQPPVGIHMRMVPDPEYEG